MWVYSQHKQSVLMREGLHAHPQIEMSTTDKRRIGVNVIEELNRL